MFKVRVLKAHRTVVMINGQSYRKDCQPGEDVFKAKIYKSDIEDGLYRPYKSQILDINGNAIKTRKRPGIDLINISEPLSGIIEAENILNDALGLIESIKCPKKKIKVPGNGNNGEEIPEESFIEEGEEIKPEYDLIAHTNYYDKVHAAIKNSMDIDKDHDLIEMSYSRPKMPIFAEMNKNNAKIEGELEIANQNIMPEKKDIFDTNPVIELVKDKKGKVDVAKTLNWKVSNLV